MPLNYSFLEEKPLTGDNLKFGHKEIANSLVDMLQTCPSPFTIGLYGKWGSGKSTITENLKAKLKENNIPVIIFDVWKHEGDALRRTFLLELIDQLKTEYGEDFFPSNYEHNDRLIGSSNRIYTTGGKVTIGFKKLWEWFKPKLKVTGGYALGIIFLFVTGYFLIESNYPKYLIIYTSITSEITSVFLNALKTFIPFAASAGLIALIIEKAIDFSTQTTDSITQSVSVDKFHDPHEFESEFASILGAFKKHRMVIAFDNLDRVSGENAVKIISTIKTFLEPVDKKDEKREVVFLIPCDVQAVKEHLVKIYKNDQEKDSSSVSKYADEFLRKFFNTIVWIPDFHSVELEKDASEKLNATRIPAFKDNDKLAWLITKVFRNNPRQIIQFINILVSNYVLLNARQVKGELGEEEFLEKNVVQLAKYLLMTQIFPDVMSKINEEKIYNLSQFKNNQIKLENFDKQLASFNMFIDETEHIPLNNLKVFFTYRKSSDEQKIPGVENLIQLLKDRQIDDALVQAKTIGIKDKPNEFSSVVKQTLDETINTATIASIIDTLFSITKELEIKLSKTTYQELLQKVSSNLIDFKTLQPELLKDELLDKYEDIRKEDKKSLLNKMLSLLTTEAQSQESQLTLKYKKSALFVLISSSKLLVPLKRDELKILIGEHYSTEVWLAEKLLKEEYFRTNLVNENYVKGLISSVNQSDFYD